MAAFVKYILCFSLLLQAFAPLAASFKPLPTTGLQMAVPSLAWQARFEAAAQKDTHCETDAPLFQPAARLAELPYCPLCFMHQLVQSTAPLIADALAALITPFFLPLALPWQHDALRANAWLLGTPPVRAPPA